MDEKLVRESRQRQEIMQRSAEDPSWFRLYASGDLSVIADFAERARGRLFSFHVIGWGQAALLALILWRVW